MVDPYQLTGDTEKAAARVSVCLKVPILASGATPADKLHHVDMIRESGKVVAMVSPATNENPNSRLRSLIMQVGDGLNDALSLAAADVGIRICHEGAVPTTGAAVTIVNSSLSGVVLLFEAAKLTQRQIRFNLAWVAVYNVVALTMAAGVSHFGFTLTP